MFLPKNHEKEFQNGRRRREKGKIIEICKQLRGPQDVGIYLLIVFSTPLDNQIFSSRVARPENVSRIYDMPFRGQKNATPWKV